MKKEIIEKYENQLKPCPFCGAKAEVKVFKNEFDDEVYMIRCSNYHVSMESSSLLHLIDVWNRRFS